MATEQQLQDAKALIKNGQKKKAIVLLRRLVREDEGDYRPWLYLAMVAPANVRAQCIAQAEAIAPQAAGVQKAKIWLAKQQSPTPAPLVGAAAPHPTESAAAPLARRKRGWFAPAAVLLLLLVLLGAGWYVWPFSGNGAADEIVVADVVVASLTPTITATATQTAVPTETAVVDDLPTRPAATPTAISIQPKQIAGSLSDEPRAQWTATPVPSPTPSPTPTIEPTFMAEDYSNLIWPEVGPNERWIDVDLTTQHLVAFEGKTPIFDTAISSGRPPYYTVTGQFRIYYRLESQTMDGRRLGFDYVTEGVPHVQYFYGDFALHGAYWHENFGQPMSHGCVNLSIPDAEWLYEWADYGMLVNVHY